MQQDMTNSFLKGIFNYRERKRILRFILPRKMKLNWEELPFSLAEGRSPHYQLAHEVFRLLDSCKIALVESSPQMFNLGVYQNTTEKGAGLYKIT